MIAIEIMLLAVLNACAQCMLLAPAEKFEVVVNGETKLCFRNEGLEIDGVMMVANDTTRRLKFLLGKNIKLCSKPTEEPTS